VYNVEDSCFVVVYVDMFEGNWEIMKCSMVLWKEKSPCIQGSDDECEDGVRGGGWREKGGGRNEHPWRQWQWKVVGRWVLLDSCGGFECEFIYI